MLNTLRTYNVHKCDILSIRRKHTHWQLLSQCPEEQSIVCVYGFKCCWQEEINPTPLPIFFAFFDLDALSKSYGFSFHSTMLILASLCSLVLCQHHIMFIYKYSIRVRCMFL